MRRADIVIAVTPGDYGKPRPAAVVQSDLFNPTHASITLCPMTSKLVDAPLFRLGLQPPAENGLQIMVDKVTTLRKGKLRQTIGCLGTGRAGVNPGLRLWLVVRDLEQHALLPEVSAWCLASGSATRRRTTSYSLRSPAAKPVALIPSATTLRRLLYSIARGSMMMSAVTSLIGPIDLFPVQDYSS